MFPEHYLPQQHYQSPQFTQIAIATIIAIAIQYHTLFMSVSPYNVVPAPLGMKFDCAIGMEKHKLAGNEREPM